MAVVAVAVRHTADNSNMNVTALTPKENPRIALLTTGLRPVPLAFADFPCTPVGIIVWDHPAAFSSRIGEVLRRVRCRLSSRPFASLRDLCAKQELKYAECDKNQPQSLTRLLEQWKIDLVITSGCAIVPVHALSPARFGAINLHPSRLPDWRGANPLFWQLANNEPLVGATVHVLSERIDGGDIIAQAEIHKPVGMSRSELTQLLEGDVGVALLKESLVRIANGELQSAPQGSSNTPYARAVSDAKLAEAAPLDSLEPDVLWDLLNFYGHAPLQWLGVRGWRQTIKWIATDWHSGGPGSTDTRPDAAALLDSKSESNSEPETGMTVDAEGWTLFERGLRIILKHKNGHIVLGPALLNRSRRKIEVQPTASFSSRHISR